MSEVFAIGRVCYKTHGRDAGNKVVVVEKASNGFVMIEGPHTKKSRANVTHLLPTSQKITLPSVYTPKDLNEALRTN
jgi:large subunit ribosomal protein L14e